MPSADAPGQAVDEQVQPEPVVDDVEAGRGVGARPHEACGQALDPSRAVDHTRIPGRPRDDGLHMGESARMDEVARLVGERYGPLARNEVVVAAPEHAAELAAYAELLPVLDDATFVAVAAEAIAESARVATAGDAQHVHARHAMVRAEAVLRHVEAGHAAHCPGVRLYALAYARAVRDTRLDKAPPAAPACTCGALAVAPARAS